MAEYYTPEISEFHVGLEFEWFDEDDKDWNKTIIKYQSELCNWTAFDDINKRIKYLDREDIESFGFITETKEGDYPTLLTKDGYIILHYYKINGLLITDKNKKLFSGKIKNKSELKVLLKQLGIK